MCRPDEHSFHPPTHAAATLFAPIPTSLLMLAAVHLLSRSPPRLGLNWKAFAARDSCPRPPAPQLASPCLASLSRLLAQASQPRLEPVAVSARLQSNQWNIFVSRVTSIYLSSPPQFPQIRSPIQATACLSVCLPACLFAIVTHPVGRWWSTARRLAITFGDIRTIRNLIIMANAQY